MFQQRGENGIRATASGPPAYPSCTFVKFLVRNASQQQIYIEIYAEKLESGSWRDADYPYDLKDPRSLYAKRVLKNPDMLKPEASLPVTYDRCLQPTFVKQDKNEFRNTIIEKDEKANQANQERIRIEIHLLEQGQLTPAKKMWSKPFKRIGGRASSAK